MLAELQRRFIRELLDGAPRLRPYRENLLCGLAEALETTYPVCRRLVGEAFFRAAARRFAEKTPSRSPDLNEYGAELAGFLQSFEPARGLPYLPDIARLEWLLQRARFAPESPALDPAALAAVPESRRGRLVFRLGAGVALLESPYPIDRIWLTNQPGYTGEDRVALDARPVHLLISAAHGRSGITALRSAEFLVFERSACGLPLDAAAADWPDTPEALAHFLARAIERRWLAGFR